MKNKNMKKNIEKWGLILGSFLIITITSCDKKIELSGFDSVAWKEDKSGCLGKRNKQLPALNQMTEQLSGVGESQMLEILGRPNRYELGERGIRNYEYYLNGDTSCLDLTEKNISRLIVYMDAIGKVTLALIKK